jgi:putative transposase
LKSRLGFANTLRSLTTTVSSGCCPVLTRSASGTLTGRIKLSFVCGERQRALLAYRAGEVDLMFVGGKCYLAVVCDMPDPEKIGIEDVRGVDFGVVNLAFDSEGRSYTGADVEKVRSRFALKRAMLQRRGTKAAKHRLKRLSGRRPAFASTPTTLFPRRLLLPPNAPVLRLRCKT